MDTPANPGRFRQDSLHNTEAMGPLSHNHSGVAALPRFLPADLYISTGSDDSDPRWNDYAHSIMDLVHEIYEDTPMPNTSTLMLPDAAHEALNTESSRDSSAAEDASCSAKLSCTGNSDLLNALEEVAQRVSRLVTSHPPPLSPLEWSHALDSPADMFTPWEDIFELDDVTFAIKERGPTAQQTTRVNRRGCAPGLLSPPTAPDASPILDQQYPRYPQEMADPELTPTLPFITYSPHSPRDLPLPDTPVDSDFMPTSYDTVVRSQRSRPKSRAAGIKNMFMRHKRSAPPSPVFSTFGLIDQEKMIGTMRSVTKPDVGRLKSLLFKEAADEVPEHEGLSFLDI